MKATYDNNTRFIFTPTYDEFTKILRGETIEGTLYFESGEDTGKLAELCFERGGKENIFVRISPQLPKNFEDVKAVKAILNDKSVLEFDQRGMTSHNFKGIYLCVKDPHYNPKQPTSL